MLTGIKKIGGTQGSTTLESDGAWHFHCTAKVEIYSLLFRASAETLLQVASDPKHLGAEIGFFSVLHTWNQQLLHHPHIHCVVPAGGLSTDHQRWISTPPSCTKPLARQGGWGLPERSLKVKNERVKGTCS